MNILGILSLLGLTGDVWQIVTRVIPVAIRLVKALDGDTTTPGKEKFQKVLTGLKEALDEDGYIVSDKTDHVLTFAVEFALLVTRHSNQTIVTPKPKAKAKKPIVPGRP